MSNLLRVTRRQGLLVAVIVTVGLVAWTAWREQSSPLQIAEVSTSRHSAALVEANRMNASNSQTAPGNTELSRDPLVDAAIDPFKATSFLPPPPKVVAPPPAPAAPQPTAPPFPYRYFGRMVEIDGKTVTYLTRDDAIIPIRDQQVLDNTYRIDTINDKQIVMTYLPLDEKTTIAVQSAESQQ